MDEEVTSLQENNTFTLSTLPQGKKPVGTKWVYSLNPGRPKPLRTFQKIIPSRESNHYTSTRHTIYLFGQNLIYKLYFGMGSYMTHWVFVDVFQAVHHEGKI